MQVEGQHGLSLLRPMATGARVSNTYPTCRLLLDSLLKGRLIQDGTGNLQEYNEAVEDGAAFRTPYQEDDGCKKIIKCRTQSIFGFGCPRV